MDNSLITPYTTALSAQKTQLENYLDSGFKAIAVPENIAQVESSKLHMLGKSAVVFLIIGIIGLVLGLFVKSTGIVVAGCAGLLTAGYLWVKGKQASKAEAFNTLSTKIFAEIQVIVDKISSQWNSFLTVQNDNLKKQIVGSNATVDSKVALIDKVEATPHVSLDLAAIQADIRKLSSGEKLSDYAAYLVKAKAAVKAAIDNASGAQQTIYSTMTAAG